MVLMPISQAGACKVVHFWHDSVSKLHVLKVVVALQAYWRAVAKSGHSQLQPTHAATCDARGQRKRHNSNMQGMPGAVDAQ